MHLLRLRRYAASLGIVSLLTPSFAHAATLLYVTHVGADNVSIVNIGTNQAVGVTIPVGDSPNDIVINGTGAYVTNNAADTVSLIDVANNKVEATISVGDSPQNIAISGTGVYVTNEGSDTVSVIDKTDNQIVTTVSVGDAPTGIAIQGTGAYVTNLSSDNVTVIDITDNQVVTTISAGDGPTAVAINGTGAYVVNSNSNNVTVIDITDNLVVTTISAGSLPITIAMSGTGGYVGNVSGGSLTVFDTTDNQVVTTVATGDNTTIMGINGTGAYLKAGGGVSRDIRVFDITNNQLEATVSLGTQLSGYGAFYVDSSTLAPVLTAPAFGASTQLCDDLTVTYTLPETPLSGSVQLQFYNETTHASVTATLNNSTGATFALDLENFTGVANVASSTSNAIIAGNYTVYLSYQDLYGNAAEDFENTNLTVTACASSSSSSSSSSSVSTGGNGGGGGRRGKGTTTVHRSSSSSSSSSSRQSASDAATEEVCQAVDSVPAFTDVPSGAWYDCFSRNVLGLKIFEGYKETDGTPKGLFGPTDDITLGQLAKVATILRNKKDLDPKPTGDRWYEEYVGAVQAYDAHVFSGTFDPLAPATRAQVIFTIMEALQIPTERIESPYSDVPESTMFSAPIATATKLGIVSGDTDDEGKPTGAFRPYDTINRAEVAKMLTLALKHVGIVYEDSTSSR